MRASFVTSEHIAADLKSFWFKPEKPLRYQAGQFTELQIKHKPTDERGDKRWFTLSSSPTEPLLAVTTKISGPGSSFKRELLDLQSGDIVSISNPMGDFVLPRDQGRELLFVAGGIGITPVRSMLKYLTDNKQRRNITTLYAARTESGLAFADIIRNSSKLHTFISDLDQKLDYGVIEEVANKLHNPLIYISGPEAMVERFYKDLRHSFPESQLITDYFHGY